MILAAGGLTACEMQIAEHVDVIRNDCRDEQKEKATRFIRTHGHAKQLKHCRKQRCHYITRLKHWVIAH